MSIILLIGLLSSLGLTLLARPLSIIQRNWFAGIGYVAIAPAVVFVAGIAAFRGYFQGQSDMRPTSVSYVVEAVTKLAFGLGLSAILLPLGLQFAVFGALSGVAISEAITFFVMYSTYRRQSGRLNLNLNLKENKKHYKEIIRISFPISVGGIIMPIVLFIDSILVVNILMRTGVSSQQATASYGMLTGPVASLINLPVVLTLSLGIAVVPAIAHIKERRDLAAIKQKSDTALKLALIIGVPFAVIYFLLARNILYLLYPRLSYSELNLGVRLLQIGAATVLILSLMQIYSSLLQGLGKTYTPVKNLAFSAVIKIILDVILLYTIGIEGVAVASFACYAICMTLNLISYKRLTGVNQTFLKNSCIICVSGAIMALAVYLASLYLAFYGIIAIIGIGSFVYAGILIVSGVFSERQLQSLPMGKIWVRASRRLRFWEGKR
jgi:stage V sporulation protein B